MLDEIEKSIRKKENELKNSKYGRDNELVDLVLELDETIKDLKTH